MLGKTKIYINFIPIRGLLEFIPFSKAIKYSINSYFDVLSDSAF